MVHKKLTNNPVSARRKPSTVTPRSAEKTPRENTTPRKSRKKAGKLVRVSSSEQMIGSDSDSTDSLIMRRRRPMSQIVDANSFNLSEKSSESDLISCMMQVRMTALNVGSSKGKFTDCEVVLDELSKIMTIRGKISTEILILQSSITASTLKNTEFALKSAGFKYDFRASDALVVKWSQLILGIQKKEAALLQERVRKRNEILSLTPGLAPALSAHSRTFAPTVMPRENMENSEE
jgi:hypothetical protein